MSIRTDSELARTKRRAERAESIPTLLRVTACVSSSLPASPLPSQTVLTLAEMMLRMRPFCTSNMSTMSPKSWGTVMVTCTTVWRYSLTAPMCSLPLKGTPSQPLCAVSLPLKGTPSQPLCAVSLSKVPAHNPYVQSVSLSKVLPHSPYVQSLSQRYSLIALSQSPSQKYSITASISWLRLTISFQVCG